MLSIIITLILLSVCSIAACHWVTSNPKLCKSDNPIARIGFSFLMIIGLIPLCIKELKGGHHHV